MYHAHEPEASRFCLPCSLGLVALINTNIWVWEALEAEERAIQQVGRSDLSASGKCFIRSCNRFVLGAEQLGFVHVKYVLVSFCRGVGERSSPAWIVILCSSLKLLLSCS